MSEPNVVLTLRRKREEIKAAILTYEKRLQRARSDLQHVTATLALFEAAGSPEGPRLYQDIQRIFLKDEMTCICMAALAERGPMSSNDLAQTVMRSRGFTPYGELQTALAKRIGQALSRQAKRGVVISTKPMKHRLWALPPELLS